MQTMYTPSSISSCANVTYQSILFWTWILSMHPYITLQGMCAQGINANLAMPDALAMHEAPLQQQERLLAMIQLELSRWS